MMLQDIHSHFVYGVDDGAPDRAHMQQLLDAAYHQGIGLLMATPHVVPGVEPFDGALFQAHLA